MGDCLVLMHATHGEWRFTEVRMRKFLLAAIVALLGAVPVLADDAAEQLTAELNRARAQAGLPPLVTDPSFNATCQSWSFYMASSGQFRHGGGEQVIAMGQRSPREVIADWLASPGHRAWLLARNVTSVGWGLAHGRGGQIYWAGKFGNTLPTPIAMSKVTTYAEVHDRVGKGEVLQVTINETRPGFTPIAPETLPKGIPDGAYTAKLTDGVRMFYPVAKSSPAARFIPALSGPVCHGTSCTWR